MPMNSYAGRINLDDVIFLMHLLLKQSWPNLVFVFCAIIRPAIACHYAVEAET
jgi:hypothetical protein